MKFNSPYSTMPHRKAWKAYHNQSIPLGWHIHHVDGNPHNNDPTNLICVSQHVHYCIHLLQGDISADFIRHAWSEKSRRKASFSHKKRVEAGTHKTVFKKGQKPTKGFTGRTHSNNISCRSDIKEMRRAYLLKHNPAKDPISLLKMQIAQQNRAPVTCPKCGKCGKGPGMYRYHFKNCKFTSGLVRKMDSAR